MSRYIPSADEQDAIDLLAGTGHVVLRRRSHEALLERARRAETLLHAEVQHAASLREWALANATETRRIADRLNAVVAAAAAQGVTIDAINKTLLAADDESAKDFG